MKANLAAWFLAAREQPGEAIESEGLATALDDALAGARTTWPAIVVDDRVYVEYLAARAASLAELRQLRTADLYLACACLGGDKLAIETFETALFGEIDRAVRQTRAGTTLGDELKQRLRQLLFVGDTRPPMLAVFAGRGDLRGWLRVIATRDLIDTMRRNRREVRVDDEQLLELLSPGEDPELGYIGDVYREQMVTAVRTALEALSPRDRRLLRMSALDGLSIDQLGVLYQVHRATVARWLQAARDSVLARTRQELAQMLGATSADVDSIVRLLAGRIDISLERLLATP